MKKFFSWVVVIWLTLIAIGLSALFLAFTSLALWVMLAAILLTALELRGLLWPWDTVGVSLDISPMPEYFITTLLVFIYCSGLLACSMYLIRKQGGLKKIRERAHSIQSIETFKHVWIKVANLYVHIMIVAEIAFIICSLAVIIYLLFINV